MAIGDIGIWRDSAGSQIPGTAYGSFNFATQERNDNSTYSKPDAATVQFGEAGLYLLRWTIQQDDDSNGRVVHKSRAIQQVGSGDFFSTHHTGYSRNNNNDEISIVGRAFINAAENDQVRIQHLRDTDVPTAGSLIDLSFLEVVKLGVDGDFDYAILEQSTGNQAYGGTTPNDVAFDATAIETDTASIELQANNTDIRLKRDNARYWVFYGITGDAGGSRTQRVSRAVAGSTLIPGSGSYTYQRNAANEHGGMLGEFMHEVGTADEDVSIQAWRGDGVAANQGGADVDGSWNTIASEVTCLVIDMPDHWNTAAYYDSTAAQDIAGGATLDLNIFRDTLWEDSPFGRDSNTDMTVTAARDLWATGTAVTARATVSSGSRLTLGLTFEIEGVNQTRGEHKQYTRGNQGTQDTFGGAWLFGGIYAVATNDTFQVETVARGDNGGDDTTRANYPAAFFLDLDNLEASGGAQDVSPGSIASAESHGATVVSVGAVDASPSAIASLEAFGTTVVTTGSVDLSPSAIASLEGFGAVVVAAGAVDVSPAAIGSQESFGTTVISAGTTLSPGSIASLESFGTTVITSTVDVEPSSISSEEAFGSTVLSVGLVDVQTPSIASAESFGALTLSAGSTSVNVSAIASGESFGSVSVVVGGVSISPSSIASLEAFGSAVLSVGASSVVPSAIASLESFGSAIVAAGTVNVSPPSIASDEGFGTATIATGSVNVSPSSVASLESHGSAIVSAGALFVTPPAISSVEAFGTSVLTTGSVDVTPIAIASAEAFGSTNIGVGAAAIIVSSIPSEESFGSVVVASGVVDISPSSIVTGESFGSMTISTGAVNLSPSSIASEESFGAYIIQGGSSNYQAAAVLISL